MESKKFPHAILCRDAKKRNLCYTYIRVCIENVLLSYTGVFCIHLFKTKIEKTRLGKRLLYHYAGKDLPDQER